MSITFGSNERGIQSSNNSGHIGDIISNHFPNSDPPEAQPRPLSTVPFQRDPNFVERGTLEEIRDQLATQTAWAALIGLGGVGKSQLAIEYAYRLRDQAPDTWVVWLHAGTAERLEQDIKSTLEALKIPGRSHPRADSFELLKTWLRNESHGPWLIILDNLDDAQVMSDLSSNGQSRGQTQSLCMNYFPTSTMGKVLVTSRYRAAVTNMVRDHAIIRIDPMTEDQAMAMIEKRLLTQHKRHELVELVQTLSYMPLAISQAAAYVNRRFPRCSISDYLEMLTDTIDTPHGVFEEEDDITRDPKAKNSILATLLISLAHIKDSQNSAAELLSLMSSFDRQDIPKALLKTGVCEDVHQVVTVIEPPQTQHLDKRSSLAKLLQRLRLGRKAECNRDSEGNAIQMEKALTPKVAQKSSSFERDLTLLVDYSFVSTRKDADTFEMHRIVQSAIQRWLRDQENKMIYWEKRFIDLLVSACPHGFAVLEKPDVCARLLPHAGRAVNSVPDETIVNVRHKQFRLLVNIEIYMALRLGPEDLKISTGGKAIEVLQVAPRILGDEDDTAMGAMYALATLKSRLGSFDEAEKIQLHMIHILGAKSGEQVVGTFRTKADLGYTYYQQGRLEEARVIQEEALHLAQLSLPCRRDDVLENMENLALTYLYLGRLGDAEKLQMSCIEHFRAWGGDEHIIRAESSKLALAAIHVQQGRREEAVRLLEEAVEITERIVGRGHPIPLLFVGVAAEYKSQGTTTTTPDESLCRQIDQISAMPVSRHGEAPQADADLVA